jgi:hypothetical protein
MHENLKEVRETQGRVGCAQGHSRKKGVHIEFRTPMLQSMGRGENVLGVFSGSLGNQKGYVVSEN